MSVPYTRVNPGITDGAQPHHQAPVLAYAIEQERRHHDDSLWSYGEFSIFLLLWNISDFQAGLVTRCQRCYLSRGKVAAVYKQASEARCPDCLGTTFEGGFKARIVRPVIWNFNEFQEEAKARGQVTLNAAQIESTSDFRLRNEDYIIRSDDTRWQVESVSGAKIHDGFHPDDRRTEGVGFAYGRVTLEDRSSPIYVAATGGDLADLDTTGAHLPTDFSSFEEIRGPILWQ